MRHSLDVRWFRSWTPELDEALSHLPESFQCPHGALKAMATAPSESLKETALVSRLGEPVAVVPLRRVGRRWEFVGQNILARSAPPAANGMLHQALRALGRDIQCWGTTDQPPPGTVHDLREEPVHVVHLQQDYEAYWHEMKNHGAVRSARKRTRKFEIQVNASGALEWTITRAHQAYGLGYQTADELAAAEWLERAGRLRSHLMVDGEKPVAGMTIHSFADGAAAGMTYYALPEYSWNQPGVRLIDYACETLRGLGYREFDLRGGSGFSYKRLWAPANERYWAYRITPPPQRIATLGVRWARVTASRAAHMVGASSLVPFRR